MDADLVKRLEDRCAALLAINAQLAADLAQGDVPRRGIGAATLVVAGAEAQAQSATQVADQLRRDLQGERERAAVIAAELADVRARLEHTVVELEAARARLGDHDQFRQRRGVRAAVWVADRVPRRRG